MESLKHKTALVTGASSGLGVAFARQLAARGANLVLTARRLERLEALATELAEEHGIETQVVACDLSDPAGVQALFEATEGAGIEIDVLINNAGAGLHRNLADTEWSDVGSQIQLNVTSLAQLTTQIGAQMRDRGRGHILNVASIGAYLPVPGFATYAASKAFVRNFSEAVSHELSPHGVRVCCLCPGGIRTEFFDAAEQTLAPWAKLALMSPERCARIGLSALFGCRRTVVSGVSNSLGMFLLRFAPRWLMTLAGRLVMGEPRALPAAT